MVAWANEDTIKPGENSMTNDCTSRRYDVLEFHSVANLFPIVEGEEFDLLVDDIRTNGLIEPIWLHPDGSIIDGRNRYRACLIAGVEPRTRRWDGIGSLVEFVISLNLRRRHLTASQRACLAAEILPLLEAEAKLRQATSGPGIFGGKPLPPILGEAVLPKLEATQPTPPTPAIEQRPESPKAEQRIEAKVTPIPAAHAAPAPTPLPSAPQAKAADKESSKIAAKQLNVSHGYVADAKKLQAEHPIKYAEVRAGIKTLQNAKAEVKQERKAAVAERIATEPQSPPKGPFRVIVVDPPWKYDSRAEDPTHRGRTPYPDMGIEEIKALNIVSFAHKDCILWLWTTNAFMREAFECLDAWGFENKTILTWTKDRMGLGNWLRGQTEHCLMAVRGKPIVTLSNQTTILAGPLREHSRKPDEFYAMVDSLCPGNKLELFSRQKRDGWQTSGVEVNHFADQTI